MQKSELWCRWKAGRKSLHEIGRALGKEAFVYSLSPGGASRWDCSGSPSALTAYSQSLSEKTSREGWPGHRFADRAASGPRCVDGGREVARHGGRLNIAPMKRMAKLGSRPCAKQCLLAGNPKLQNIVAGKQFWTGRRNRFPDG